MRQTQVEPKLNLSGGDIIQDLNELNAPYWSNISWPLIFTIHPLELLNCRISFDLELLVLLLSWRIIHCCYLWGTS